MMQRLAAFRLIISLAALLFVAKPFMGFGTFNKRTKPHFLHSVLVKSFTKRKPESLAEADEKAEAIHKSLTSPALPLLSAITFLLTLLLPLIFKSGMKLTSGFFANIRAALIPAGQTYLLTGKLTI
jgi:hypothetical protein